MKNKLFLFTICCLCFFSANKSFCQLKILNIGTPNKYETTIKMIVCKNGDRVISALQYNGTTPKHFDSTDALLLRVTPNNEIIWAYKIATPNRDRFSSMVEDHQGNLLVCGYMNSIPNSNLVDGFYFKVNATGDIIWQKKINTKVGIFFSHLIQLSSGDLAMVGGLNGVYGANDGIICILDSVGNPKITKNINFGYLGLSNSDGLEYVFEYNNKLLCVGLSRAANYSEYHNILTCEINIQTGALIESREFEFGKSILGSWYLNTNFATSVYLINDHLLMATSSGYGWTIESGRYFSVLDIDLKNDYKNVNTSILPKNTPFACFSNFFPVNENEYYVSFMPTKSYVHPESDNLLGRMANSNFNNTVIAKIKNSKLEYARQNGDKGIRGISEFKLNSNQTRIISAGVSEFTYNQIGLQDISLMSCDINLNSGNGCSFVDTVFDIEIDTAKSWRTTLPELSFTFENIQNLVMEKMPISKSIIANSLTVQNACYCSKDSIINDSICNGKSYALPNGKLVVESGKYYLYTIDNRLCDVHVYLNLSVSNSFKPKASFTVRQKIFPNFYFENESTGATSYRWNFDDPNSQIFNNSTLKNPEHKFFENTGFKEICLIAMNDAGCSDTFCDQINVSKCEEQLFFSNVFTPNNDGINDSFYASGNCVKEFYMAIYNRWGAKLYETNDINKGWNGSYMNVRCPDGVYIYLVKTQFESYKKMYFKGAVALLR